MRYLWHGVLKCCDWMYDFFLGKFVSYVEWKTLKRRLHWVLLILKPHETFEQNEVATSNQICHELSYKIYQICAIFKRQATVSQRGKWLLYHYFYWSLWKTECFNWRTVFALRNKLWFGFMLNYMFII